MEGNQDDTALETIELLESRLHRVQFLLTGDIVSAVEVQRNTGARKDPCVIARLKALEHALTSLSAKSRVAHAILHLHARYPDFFQSQPANEIPSSLTTASLFTIVNSCATLYHTSASRLTSIQDVAIPSANASASLIELNARLARIMLLQDAQSAEIAELRSRSVALIE
ncbi:MAG: hypothetical protein M1830_010708, partial [Pleopsidium flavum]